MDYWLVDRRPGSADDAVPTLILLMNWSYTKMASREIIIICIRYLKLSVLCTKYYQNWSMNVEDIATQEQCYF